MQVCGHFQRGNCSFGQKCKFAHVAPDSVDKAKVPSRVADSPLQACAFYLRGDCKFGAKCKFQHPKPPVRAAGTEKDKPEHTPSVNPPSSVPLLFSICSNSFCCLLFELYFSSSSKLHTCHALQPAVEPAASALNLSVFVDWSNIRYGASGSVDIKELVSHLEQKRFIRSRHVVGANIYSVSCSALC